LPLTQKILSVVLRYAEINSAEKVIEVCLEIGDLRDFVESITQKYWNYLSKGTVAEGAIIKFDRVTVSFICHSCNNTFYFDFQGLDKSFCPECGSFDSELLTGTELEVKEISII
jgi:hydrogenase nickel incorporation protein HypA/HybF